MKCTTNVDVTLLSAGKRLKPKNNDDTFTPFLLACRVTLIHSLAASLQIICTHPQHKIVWLVGLNDECFFLLTLPIFQNSILSANTRTKTCAKKIMYSYIEIFYWLLTKALISCATGLYFIFLSDGENWGIKKLQECFASHWGFPSQFMVNSSSVQRWLGAPIAGTEPKPCLEQLIEDKTNTHRPAAS